MNRANPVIFIGGFGSNRTSMERACLEFEKYFPDVIPVIFRKAMEDRQLPKRLRGHSVITHSAGILALNGNLPEDLTAFNPPVPSSVVALIRASLGKRTQNLANSARGYADVSPFRKENTRELLLHSYGNLRHLGRIAAYDSLEEVRNLSLRGMKSTLVWTTEDHFFPLPEPGGSEARDAYQNVDVVILPGGHDDLLLQPGEIVPKVLGPSRLA